MIKYFLSLFIVFFLHQNIINAAIFVTPRTDVILYGNIYSDRLNPFSTNDMYYRIAGGTPLRLIRQIPFDNGLCKDIVFVEVEGGYYKGIKGFIYRDLVVLTSGNSLEYPDIVFLEDYTYDNVTIRKGEIYSIVDRSYRNDSGEILFIVKNKNIQGQRAIILDNTTIVRFILDRRDDIGYQLNNGNPVLRVVSTRSSIPLNGFSNSNGAITDDQGYAVQGVRRGDIFNKNGFTPVIVSSDRLNLNFSAETNRLVLSSDSITKIDSDDGYISLIVMSLGSSHNHISYSFLNSSLSDKLAVPNPGITGLRLLRATYTGIDNGEIGITVVLNSDSGSELMVYDISTKRWNIPLITIIDGKRTINISDSSFIAEFGSINSELPDRIIRLSDNYSMPQFLERSGNVNFCNNEGFINNSGVQLELICQTIDDPLNIYRRIVEVNSGAVEIDNTGLEYNGEKDGFSRYYNGIWKRDSFRINNRLVDPNLMLEGLGDMEIISPNRIIFNNNGIRIDGEFIRTGQDKGIIIIRYCTVPVRYNVFNTLHILSDSIFDSELMIPVNISITAGVLEIGFDAIYWKRRTTSLISGFNGTVLQVSGYGFGNPAYPANQNRSVYRVFFVLK